jgi:hypothetical protein
VYTILTEASNFASREMHPWTFGKCPNKFWDDMKNQKQFVDWTAKQLNIDQMSDWYNISSKVIVVQGPVQTSFLGIK